MQDIYLFIKKKLYSGRNINNTFTHGDYPGFIFYKYYEKSLMLRLPEAFELAFVSKGATSGVPMPAPAY